MSSLCAVCGSPILYPIVNARNLGKYYYPQVFIAELFTDKFEEEICEPSDIPKDLQGYCLDPEDGKLLCPKYFNRLDIGNYLNHSPEPNITYKKDKGYFAMQNISKDEELLADYRELGEPEETWAVYYN